MNGRQVVVTGASRGIGLQTAKVLAARGYALVLTASSRETAGPLAAEEFVRASGARVEVLELSDRASVTAFAASIREPLWGLVNNAAVCKTLGLLDEGPDPFDEVLATNLTGVYALTRLLAPRLTRPGRIVNIASQLGQEGRAQYAAYCASKFGLVGMTKCWAKELGAHGITVNAVCPGWVDTEMSRIDMERMARERGMATDAFYAEICEPLELRRFNSTDEVANLIAFLLSDEASGITGRDWLMQTVWNQL